MRFSKITIFFIASLLLAACIQTSSEPPIVRTRVVNAPPLSDNPPPQFDFAAGAELYASSCAACHGEQGLGDGAAAAGFTCPMPQLALYPAETNLKDWFEIVQNGKRSSETCIMPPWSQRLTSEQMWQAVFFAANLRYDSNLLGLGESLLAEAQTDTDTAYLNTVAWQISQTDADILNAVSQNTLPSFDFGSNELDEQAVLAAIRARAYSSAPQQAPVQTEEVEVAQNSTPESVPTDSPTAEATQNITPEPVQTEESALPTATADSFILSGKLINGTVGGSLPNDLPVTLRVVAINDAGEPEEIYSRELTPNAEQIFNFTDVPLNPRALAVLETDYAEQRQRSPEIFVGEITEDLYLFDFTVYETTSDSSGLTILYSESLVDAVTAEGAALIFQNYEVVNTLDRILLPNEAGYTFQMPLPTEASNASIEAFRSAEGRFQQVEEDGRIVFYDTFPIYPNSPERITVSFGMPYNGSMTIEQPYLYPVQQLGVYVSQTRGLKLESAQLSSIESGTLNNVVYAGWGLTDLSANSTLSYRVLDGETTQTTASAEDGSFLEENTTLILGFGVILIVLGGMFMVYDLQKTRLKTQLTVRHQDDILAEIAALDADYEQGVIDEIRYQRQRQALKEELSERLQK